MPSGAKKRKAAKKKKEQAANSPSTGNDDPKSQDERDSDGGDAGSPASQDGHNHHHPFSQGGDDGKRAQSHITEEKPLKEDTKDAKRTEKSRLDDVDIKIEKGWEANKDPERTHVSIQHDKTSSSSSSSGDESQASEKKSNGQACKFGSEVASYSTEDVSANVFSEEAPKVAGKETVENVDSNSAVETVAVDNSVPDEFESGFKENEEKILPTSNGIPGVEAKVFTSSDIPPAAETSNVAEKYQASEHHDNSENQPLVASTPPPLQRTSLLSCCGLFEVFTGSGR